VAPGELVHDRRHGHLRDREDNHRGEEPEDGHTEIRPEEQPCHEQGHGHRAEEQSNSDQHAFHGSSRPLLPAPRRHESWRRDLNSQPPDYKSGALPIAPLQRNRDIRRGAAIILTRQLAPPPPTAPALDYRVT